ncbi:MAG: hypothetical protein BZ135_01870 [Methanosphaera sp. rholeuAM6]|nr:MAG: hypothetical protein BZ135_01870 [Methanosphaera sp. rholeuAM6]
MNRKTVYAGILGGVVADALGVPYEFNSYEQMQENPATEMTGYGTYHQPPGSWSDDSSMTIATMDSLINGVDYEDMIGKFCEWLFDAKYTPRDVVFDHGKTTYCALYNYRHNHLDSLECGQDGVRDNGNGSLMRIMPVSLYAYAKGLQVEEQMGLIDNVSSLTHAHSISKASCNIFNFVVQEVLNNPDEDFKALIENALDKSGKYYDNDEYDCFNRIYDSLFLLNDDEIGSGGYVVASLEVALYSCYHTDNYEEAVLRAVNYGGDTDTNAIIAGGLAAVYYGFDGIPDEWLDTLIRLDYIKGLCDEFYKSLK